MQPPSEQPEQPIEPPRLWCLGLPLVEERLLTSQEREEYRRAARRHGLGCWAWGCAFPFFLLAMMIVSGGLNDVSARLGLGPNSWPFLWLLVPLFVAAGWPLLKANDKHKVWRWLKQEIKSGRVLVFQGPPSAFVARENLTPEESEHELVTMQVGAASGRVLSLNGRTPPALWHVEPQSVARPPEWAAQAAAWARVEASMLAEPLGRAEQDAPPLRRELSLDEKDEARRLSRRVVRRALWPALFFLAWIILPLGGALATGSRIVMEPGAYLLLVLCATSCWNLRNAWLLSRRMGQDAREGHVAVIATPLEPDFEDEAPGDESEAEERVVLEVLPLSGWVWTVNGAPAAWRSMPLR